jgi:hypothetical protein
MRQVKRLLMAGGMVALMAALLGAPVAAAGSGKVVFVQGTPGTKVDICVGGNEVVSNLAYAKYATRTLPAGNRVVRFFKAHSGACVGTRLATWNPTIGSGSLQTVAITKFAPKVVVFDTTTLPAPSPGFARMVWRWATDVDGLSMRWQYGNGTVWYPTADAVFAKGDQGVGVAQVDLSMFLWGYVQPDLEAVFGPILVVGDDNWLYEEVVVGSSLANLKVVRIERLWPFA